MADELNNAGGGGAAVADAAPAAAPAAAPSSDAGSAGGSGSAAAAVEAPAVVIDGPSESESTATFLTRAAETRKKAELKVVDPAVPAKKDEPVLTAEQLAEKAEADRVAAEKKVADDKAAAEQADKDKKPADATEEEEEFELNPIGPLPPRELAAKLKENPELAAAVEKSGLKDQLFAASRLASRVAAFEEVFPDIEVAKYAAQSSQQFGVLAEKFTGIKDADTARTFMQSLLPFSYVLDEDGNPQVDADSKLPISDGSVGRFMDNVLGMVLDYQAEQAKKEGNEDAMAAIDLLKARTGRGPASAEEEGMTDAQKKEAERLKAEREAINREKTQGAERKTQEFELNVQKDIDSDIGKLVDGILDKVELSDFDRKVVRGEIISTLEERVAASPNFFMQMDALMRRPLSDKVRKERVSLAMRTVKAIIKPVAQEKLNAAGAKMKDKLDQKIATQAAREQASRSDLRGAARPAQPANMPSDAELQAEVLKEYGAKNNGDEPSTAQLFTLMSAKRKQYAAR